MKAEERIALHRCMAEGYHGAYDNQHKDGEATLSSEWKFAKDAVYFSLYFTGPEQVLMSELVQDSGGSSMTDGAAAEAKVYSAAFPDWGPREFKSWPSETGFVTRTRFSGRTLEGVEMDWHMVDFVETNAEGEINYWETFCDGEEFGPVVQRVVGKRGPFTNRHDYGAALRDRYQQLFA